jgi:hypothetical protein
MNRQIRVRTFGTALLMTAALALPGAVRAAGDPGVTHIDGYYTGHRGRCSELREHDGKIDYLAGNLGGLKSGDHVRLEGRFVDSRVCGGTAVEVSTVQAIWADDKHRTTYYDQLQNGSFDDWAAANRGTRGRRGDRGYGRHNR